MQTPDPQFVIFSASESADSDYGAGFWSNEIGWCDFESATLFSDAERETLDLPISSRNDAQWVSCEEIRASLRAPASRKPTA